MILHRLKYFGIFSLCFIFTSNLAYPCSVFLVSPNIPVVAKNLDWFAETGRVYVNPRGLLKNAILIDTQNPLKWTSKYQSLTFSGNGIEFPWEGMNEAGLSVDVLQLVSSQTSLPTNALPSVNSVQWVQYILDTSANLQEALSQLKAVRVSARTKLHYFICDASPACATVELIGGQLVIHSGNDLPYRSLTNDSYQDSVTYMASLQGHSDQQILYTDWSVKSLPRFSRAAVWSKNFDAGSETPVDHAFKGLFNLAQFVPPTASSPGWRTYWSIAFDLKNKKAFWRTQSSPQIKSVSLEAFSLNCADSAKGLDLSIKAEGDVSSRFFDWNSSLNTDAVQAWVHSLPTSLRPYPVSADAIAQFPKTVKCAQP